jgi:hypothetical protein
MTLKRNEIIKFLILLGRHVLKITHHHLLFYHARYEKSFACLLSNGGEFLYVISKDDIPFL